ncbi:universal stress protein [Haloarcula nitratireducens]|uniref:Universal stress protein n=1 Tax=Haloarcula nitratireducens TaxID=2487749 RepID=A0AAW4PAS1_9EURY|nr:universal stress protein [Halomicroarcula nitratireducens]MBX0294575.1 universal stress protein [Halomicroarcula nitratireducens]
MYDDILFPTDGSDMAASVLEYVADVAAAHDATLYVLHVADTNRDSVSAIQGEVVDALEEAGERIVSETTERVRDRGIDVRSDVVQGDPARTIVEYADRIGADLVTLPTHGRSGLERVLLGSVTERVVNTAPVPVLVVNPDGDRTYRYPPRDVLVPTDGSAGAKRALEEGVEIAAATGATLHVLHVVETGSLGPDARSVVRENQLDDHARELVDSAVETAEATLSDVVGTVGYGTPHREIRTYVDSEDIDLLALGTQGQTDFSWYALGGVSSKLVRASPVPLVMTRTGDE